MLRCPNKPHNGGAKDGEFEIDRNAMGAFDFAEPALARTSPAGDRRFTTKLPLAARLVEWIAPILKNAGKTVWIVVDGGYTKRPFLRRVLKLANVVVVGRLRKDAALRNLPDEAEKRPMSRSRPATQVWQESLQPSQTRRAQARLANHPVHIVPRDGHQDVQNFPGPLRAGRSGDSRGVGQGSVGVGPTASAQHLDQPCRVSLESLDAYPRGIVGLEPQSQATF